MNFTPRILYEDNHLLIVDKPAGMLTQGDASGRISLLEHLKAYLKKRDNKPGNVFLGMVQRLDKPVSGVLVFAKTSKAAKRVSEQIRGRRLVKCYLAVTQNNARTDSEAAGLTGEWVEVAQRVLRAKDRTIVSDRAEGGQSAIMRLKTLFIGEQYCLHAIRLITGRKHQIRAQLSARGMVVCGDWKYGAERIADGDRILLHSYVVRLVHPTAKTDVEVICPPPEALLSRFSGEEDKSIRNLLAKTLF